MQYLDELRQHSFSDMLGMAVSFVWTRIFYGSAVLIRRPFHLRGNRKALRVSSGFTAGRGCRFELFGEGRIVFGSDCHIGDNVHVASNCLVEFGNDCLLASKIFISDLSHGSYVSESHSFPATAPNERPLISKPIRIGDKVWIGENAVILPGVTIGDGCVVGANSTVTKDIPDACIAAGSPAKVIKKFDEDHGAWVSV